MNKPVIDKYLENYAEDDIYNVPECHEKWDEVIAIPSYNEYDELLFLLNENIPKIVREKKLLVILTVNGNEKSTETVHFANKKLLEILEVKNDSLISLKKLHNYDLMVINRATDGKIFESKFGVGLARKIGFDVALSLYKKGHIKTEWIRSTDADVTLPGNYLEINPDPAKYSAITYSFYHDCITDEYAKKALQYYEIFLRYYNIGLMWSGSPYAFHTIGSSMAISVSSYAKVRGFPRKREAAEDFYVLNKLAKVSPVFCLSDSVIRIKGRISDRVPFGTGASISKISKLILSGKEYEIYNPEIFNILKKFHILIDIFTEIKKYDLFLNKLTKEEKNILNVVEALGIESAFINSAKLSARTEIIKKHIYNYFDGFKTLKFIHILNNKYFEPLPIYEALNKAVFLKESGIFPSDLENIREKMFFFEKDLLYKEGYKQPEISNI